MSTYGTSECPHCGADVDVKYWQTYQGVRPHGGYVNRSEITDKSCDCEWSEGDFDQIEDEAHIPTKADRNFSPEELNRTRY